MWARIFLFWLLLLSTAWGQVPEPTDSFLRELKRLGQPSFEALRMYAPRDSVSVDWDPTNAKFWKELNTKPLDPGPGKIAKPDLSLSAAEISLFKKNGFLVSERLGRDTMTGVLYRVYNADLPVFISADSILHAWHQSFADAYTDIELQFLAPTLTDVLTSMHDALPKLKAGYQDKRLSEACLEVDILLTTALSLSQTETTPSKFGNDKRVAEWVQHCNTLAPARLTFCGRNREIDFGALKVRGRYEKLPALHGYFRTVTFFQQMGFQLDSGEQEFLGALVLADLLRKSPRLEEWRKFETILNKLVGHMDGASLLQLSELMGGDESPPDWERIRGRVKSSDFGVEQIATFQYYDPNDAKPSTKRFCYLTGARFTYGSWVLNQMTFGRVAWEGRRVQRRLPSGIDVCFALLSNDQLASEIVRRLSSGNIEWRDRLPYHHNLLAARSALDSIFANKEASPSVCESWLQTLRSLASALDPKAPMVTRTAQWRLRLANSQLASWSELRHTIVADAKPSFTGGTLCSYPEGYVEPNPAFWSRFRRMSDEMVSIGDLMGERNRVNGFFKRFSATVERIESIANKQMNSQNLSTEEVRFLQTMMETGPQESGGANYSGWYFKLFYNLSWDDFPERWEPTVADVHVSLADPVSGAPTMILCQGTGAADLLIVSIENKDERCIYLGPTTSYFEWTGETRVSDSEWMSIIERGETPDRPSWTSDYLLPIE